MLILFNVTIDNLLEFFLALHGLSLLSQYYHFQLDQIMLTDEDNNTFSGH